MHKVFRVIYRRVEEHTFDIVDAFDEADAVRVLTDYFINGLGHGRPANIVALEVEPKVRVEIEATRAPLDRLERTDA